LLFATITNINKYFQKQPNIQKINIFKNRKYRVFSLESFLGFSKMDKKNVQKPILPKYFPKNTCFVTIIEIYGLVTKKIIFSL